VKCIVTDYVEPNLDWELEQYEAGGIETAIFQLRGADPVLLLEHVADADVLVVDQARITREVIAGLTRCKLIIRHGDGYDNLEVTEASQAGILCANKPGFWSSNVAEQTLLLALALIRRFSTQAEIAASQPAGDADVLDLSPAMPMRRVRSMTAGIVGYGRIGSTVAAVFSALFDRVLVCDPKISAGDTLSPAGNVIGASAQELYAHADLVSLHVPATSETTGMIDAAVFARMKPGSYLVNTARGVVVDTDALVEAIGSGTLAGAALDVTAPEPLSPDHPLRSFDNVIVTPHLGWYSEDALWNLRRSIVADVIGLQQGRVPTSVLNPQIIGSPVCRLTAR
jgi:D-3-phosphoglycerate dehydrogenase / 2-oxoglutarate reductase